MGTVAQEQHRQQRLVFTVFVRLPDDMGIADGKAAKEGGEHPGLARPGSISVAFHAMQQESLQPRYPSWAFWCPCPRASLSLQGVPRLRPMQGLCLGGCSSSGL